MGDEQIATFIDSRYIHADTPVVHVVHITHIDRMEWGTGLFQYIIDLDQLKLYLKLHLPATCVCVSTVVPPFSFYFYIFTTT